MNRIGRPEPSAKASPLPSSMASSIGSPTTATDPPINPLSIARRLRTNRFMTSSSLRLADELERGARGELHEEVLQLVARRGEAPAELVDHRLLALGLHMTQAVAEDVLDDARRDA